MDNFTIEYTAENGLLIYKHDFSEFPWVTQPRWADGTPFASEAQAMEWAEIMVQSVTDPTYQFLPPAGPGEPLIKKPVIDPETGLPVEPTDTEA